MAAISLLITESSLQIVAGIPKSVSIDSSVPASIFYTLDQSEPTTNSLVYVEPIVLPTDDNSVVLKIFATDGTDTSAIVTKTYATNNTGLRRPYAQVLGLNNLTENRANSFPFGSAFESVPVTYGTSAGLIVDAPDKPNFPDGYDGSGTGTSPGGTDLPLSAYDLIFSTSNSIGERGHGIGTLPTQTTLPPPVNQPISSNINDRLFNPKALVIYQDNRETPFDPNVSHLNRQFFSLEDPEKVRTGALLFNTGFDGMQPTGSFVRAHYNARENTTTYYYFDSMTLRWIISKEPCQPKKSVPTGLFNVTFSSRQEGVGMVFKWLPFVGRRLI